MPKSKLQRNAEANGSDDKKQKTNQKKGQQQQKQKQQQQQQQQKQQQKQKQQQQQQKQQQLQRRVQGKRSTRRQFVPLEDLPIRINCYLSANHWNKVQDREEVTPESIKPIKHGYQTVLPLGSVLPTTNDANERIFYFHKVFVGGLPYDLELCYFRECLSVYGKLAEVKICLNEELQSRGFGLVSFFELLDMMKLLKDKFISIGGKIVEVKPIGSVIIDKVMFHFRLAQQNYYNSLDTLGRPNLQAQVQYSRWRLQQATRKAHANAGNAAGAQTQFKYNRWRQQQSAANISATRKSHANAGNAAGAQTQFKSNRWRQQQNTANISATRKAHANAGNAAGAQAQKKYNSLRQQQSTANIWATRKAHANAGNAAGAQAQKKYNSLRQQQSTANISATRKAHANAGNAAGAQAQKKYNSLRQQQSTANISALGKVLADAENAAEAQAQYNKFSLSPARKAVIEAANAATKAIAERHASSSRVQPNKTEHQHASRTVELKNRGDLVSMPSSTASSVAARIVNPIFGQRVETSTAADRVKTSTTAARVENSTAAASFATRTAADRVKTSTTGACVETSIFADRVGTPSVADRNVTPNVAARVAAPTATNRIVTSLAADRNVNQTFADHVGTTFVTDRNVNQTIADHVVNPIVADPVATTSFTARYSATTAVDRTMNPIVADRVEPSIAAATFTASNAAASTFSSVAAQKFAPTFSKAVGAPIFSPIVGEKVSEVEQIAANSYQSNWQQNFDHDDDDVHQLLDEPKPSAFDFQQQPNFYAQQSEAFSFMPSNQQYATACNNNIFVAQQQPHQQQQYSIFHSHPQTQAERIPSYNQQQQQQQQQQYIPAYKQQQQQTQQPIPEQQQTANETPLQFATENDYFEYIQNCTVAPPVWGSSMNAGASAYAAQTTLSDEYLKKTIHERYRNAREAHAEAQREDDGCPAKAVQRLKMFAARHKVDKKSADFNKQYYDMWGCTNFCNFSNPTPTVEELIAQQKPFDILDYQPSNNRQ